MIKARLTKNRLPELRGKTRDRAIAVINKHARIVAGLAKQFVPVDTGALKASIAVSQSSLGTVRVVAGMPYAVFVEFGTSRMPAQPFLFPAVESDRSQLMRDLKRVIQ